MQIFTRLMHVKSTFSSFWFWCFMLSNSALLLETYAKSDYFMLWIAVLSFAICPPLLNQILSSLGAKKESKWENQLFILTFINYKFQHLSVLLLILKSIFLNLLRAQELILGLTCEKWWENIFLGLKTVKFHHSFWGMGRSCELKYESIVVLSYGNVWENLCQQKRGLCKEENLHVKYRFSQRFWNTV